MHTRTEHSIRYYFHHHSYINEFKHVFMPITREYIDFILNFWSLQAFCGGSAGMIEAGKRIAAVRRTYQRAVCVPMDSVLLLFPFFLFLFLMLPAHQGHV